MSMGALLLAAGARGKRMALPNAKSSFTSSGGFEGEASDIEIQARETIALKRRIEELIVQHSGQTPEKGLRRYGTRLLHDRGGSRRVRIIDRVLTHRFD